MSTCQSSILNSTISDSSRTIIAAGAWGRSKSFVAAGVWGRSKSFVAASVWGRSKSLMFCILILISFLKIITVKSCT
jgi:hypothetical protein